MDFLKVISSNNKITTGFEALNSVAGTFRYGTFWDGLLDQIKLYTFK